LNSALAPVGTGVGGVAGLLNIDPTFGAGATGFSGGLPGVAAGAPCRGGGSGRLRVAAASSAVRGVRTSRGGGGVGGLAAGAAGVAAGGVCPSSALPRGDSATAGFAIGKGGVDAAFGVAATGGAGAIGGGVGMPFCVAAAGVVTGTVRPRTCLA